MLRLIGLSCRPKDNSQAARLVSFALTQDPSPLNELNSLRTTTGTEPHQQSVQRLSHYSANSSDVSQTTTTSKLGGIRSDWGHDVSISHPFCAKMKSRPVLAQAPLCKRRDDMSCKEGPQKGQVPFFSQVGQDYYVYTRHFQHLTSRSGSYLEAGTRHPVGGSNTYFMDACLRWDGICVEGSPNTLAYIHRARSCEVVPTCVAQHDGARRVFALRGAVGGKLGDESMNNGSMELPTYSLKIPCLSIQAIFDRRNVRVLDFLSLDVDGHELDVLKGIDHKRSRVNVMTVATMDETLPHIQAYLEAYGYVRHIPDLDAQSNHSGLLRNDAIFVHRSVRWGHPI